MLARLRRGERFICTAMREEKKKKKKTQRPQSQGLSSETIRRLELKDPRPLDCTTPAIFPSSRRDEHLVARHVATIRREEVTNAPLDQVGQTDVGEGEDSWTTSVSEGKTHQELGDILEGQRGRSPSSSLQSRGRAKEFLRWKGKGEPSREARSCSEAR